MAIVALRNGKESPEERTYADFDSRVSKVSAALIDRALAGKTVLLSIRDPLQFAETFFGCVRGGVIPVPLTPARLKGESTALEHIARDCGAVAMITDDVVRDRSVCRPNPLAEIDCIDGNELRIAGGQARAHPHPRVAFLQYTSGSTGAPNGVVVTHSSLAENLFSLTTALHTSSASVFVSWLPLHHDMGLIGHLIHAIYSGARCVLMSPAAFLQRPLRWLEAISRFRGTNSGGPNFAYDMCVRRISTDQRRSLDLTSWGAAYNGGEPVRAKTINDFCDAYSSVGFRRSAMFPCYGLAEATLFVSGNLWNTAPKIVSVDKAQLELGVATPASASSSDCIELVSSGRVACNVSIAVVDEITEMAVDDGIVGEIWVTGPSIGAGYYSDGEGSRSMFEARISGTPTSRYLRTGDLGFLRGGDLYIVGRRKDVIVIHGRNHYPQDLEDSAYRFSSSISPGRAAAVVIDDNGERLGVFLVCELTRRAWRERRFNDISADLIEGIASVHGVSITAVLFTAPGTLPVTTSGKLRRASYAHLIRTGQLEVFRCGPELAQMARTST